MTDSRKFLVLALVLFAISVALYWPTTRQGFAVVDDNEYVTENPWVNQGLSWDAARWAFTTFHAANWHPLTWLSHQADCSLHGSFAGGHHLTNAILHGINALLLFLFLGWLTEDVACSWITAAFFAWHPLRVESVAWIAERKDLLSTLCLLISIWAYCCYAKLRKTASAQHGNERSANARTCTFYWLALLVFAAGLMCKPMVVTLPFLLLLLDFWPLRRLVENERNPSVWARLFVEKIPFFMLSAAGCWVTLLAQRSGGAVKTLQAAPMSMRICNALASYAEYLYQTFWPDPLCIIYPFPQKCPVGGAVAGAALICGVTLLAWIRRRHSPWLITGWLWFLGSLVPVIGLVKVGFQAHADRYTYIPSIGLCAAIIWETKNMTIGSRAASNIAKGVTGCSLLACLVLTRHQLSFWNDNVKLFSHALAHTADNAFAQNNLGVALSKAGESKEAILHYREAIRLDPMGPGAYYNLGTELAKKGELSEAGDALVKALQFSPRNESLLNNLGVVLARQEKYQEALGCFEKAIASNPIYPKSYLNAGSACQALGLAAPALSNYSAALRLAPDSTETMRHCAYLLATCPEKDIRQVIDAVRLGERAVQLTHGQIPEYLETLAIAYAEAGRFEEAIATAGKALKIAEDNRPPTLAARLQDHLAAYQHGKLPTLDWKRQP